MPTAMASKGMRALYNNLEQNEELVIKIDVALKAQSPANWRGNKAKENIVKNELYQILQDIEEVERIFEIVKEQAEY